MWNFHKKLESLQARQLFRQRRIVQSAQSPEIEVDGKRLLAFCSNDYLGLAADIRVAEAMKHAVDQYGVGAGASHLVSGHHHEHHALEEELAEFVGMPRALLFSTGYMANLAVVNTLLDRHGVVYEDRLNHASLIDAARLSPARVLRYAHGDAMDLVRRIADSDSASSPGLVVTDGVFSMDGDLAPLPALLDVTHQQNFRLLLDDAHGLGVLGATGRGSFEHFGLTPVAPAILMGTLGKALGTFGAFVAAEPELIETLIQQARTYIYTTALPPAVAAATRASLKIVRQEDWRRSHLQALVQRFRQGAANLGFDILPSDSPIQALVLGSEDRALAASRQLEQLGILVTAIRPPTVPAGTARLRITFSASHSESQVDRLLEGLSVLARGLP